MHAHICMLFCVYVYAFKYIPKFDKRSTLVKNINMLWGKILTLYVSKIRKALLRLCYFEKFEERSFLLNFLVPRIYRILSGIEMPNSA